MTTPYEFAGGEEALHRLEEVFYAKALADPLDEAGLPDDEAGHSHPTSVDRPQGASGSDGALAA